MAEIALVACAKTKSTGPSRAITLYESALFRKSVLAALDRTKTVYILSAEHGLVEPGTVLAPYEKTLKTLPAAARRAWGERVAASLRAIAKPRDQLVLYAGDDYAEPLRSALTGEAYVLEAPLGARSLGARLQRLRQINAEAHLETELRRLERLLLRLSRAQAGGRRLADCNGRLLWPERGLYFVTEPVATGGRWMVTRVGTHAVSVGSRTSLWNRISTHRGPSHGGGSHRSSIFRSHVGRALLRRCSAASQAMPTWGIGQSAPVAVRAIEAGLERRVSQTIGEMQLLWLEVPDAPTARSDRAYLERNIIGLLSRANYLGVRTAPNQLWLGHDSADWRIAASGLWNLDHLFYRPDPGFLDVLEAYVDATCRGVSPGVSSRAPAGWGMPAREPHHEQLVLFDDTMRAHGA
jgi:hypothetical protein